MGFKFSSLFHGSGIDSAAQRGKGSKRSRKLGLRLGDCRVVLFKGGAYLCQFLLTFLYLVIGLCKPFILRAQIRRVNACGGQFGTKRLQPLFLRFDFRSCRGDLLFILRHLLPQFFRRGGGFAHFPLEFVMLCGQAFQLLTVRFKGGFLFFVSVDFPGDGI